MTQQYTEVPWQDETTSQQGTLINAERLNQMQQAHHYADGLEEVDAVPTADPGVEYHKIVYCTADNTLYRWDGTEWTADIDDETKRLLEQEIARATAAEGGLAQDIADEATARETADTAMQADISALESGKLDKKTTVPNQTQVYAVRSSAQRMITAGYSPDAIPLYNVEQTLFSKMPSLFDPIDDTVINYGWATAQIGAEATARADADTALGGRIDTEQTRAEAAEQAYAQAIANTYTKAEADTLLAGKASTTAVQTLDTRVGTLETGLADTYNKSQTDTMLAGKADQATTYSKTETDTLLAGYVTLGTAQTITAIKTLTIENGLRRITNYAHGSGGQATWKLAQVDKDGNNLVMVDIRDDGTSRGVHLRAFDNNGNNYTALATNTQVSDGTSFVQIATRGYNPAYTSDVATIGTLDQYAPMVRTTGNQVIGAGVKTFLSDTNHGDATHPDSASLILWASGAFRRFRMRSNVDDVTTTPASNVGYGMINFSDKNDQTVCNILLTHKSTGGYKLEAVIKTSNNNTNVFTIGETS